MNAKRRSVVVLILAGLLLGSCGGGSSPTQPSAAPAPACQSSDSQQLVRGSSQGVLISDGVCREYLAHVPPSYDASRPTPVVIAMHGYSGDPSSMEGFSGLSGTADAEGFIVVYPAGLRNAWDLSVSGMDVRFLRTLIASVQTRANVDRRRIYVTGHSMGGAMSARAACELADVVAAAAPVSGGHPAYEFCSPQRPIAILVIHGSADPVVPPEGRPDLNWPPISVWVPAWARRNHCAASPVVSDLGEVVETVWPGCAGGSEVRLKMVQGLDHSWWQPASDELWRFFEGHTLPS
jgi:polyhydroxybutyrate depolymerase